jgi:hypothetical protein
MNLFKPRPEPVFALLAIVVGVFGFFTLEKTRAGAAALFVVAAWLLISFIRGLVIDLSIAKEGLMTSGRVTKVEHKKEKRKGEEVEWWDVYFTFTDNSGAAHEESIDLWDRDEARRYEVGSSVKIRYHPHYPEMWRWME